ncbi:hypothetical protein [Bradyrhizobium sp. OK095]|jgi:hypothetical protein|uniref:hypothetical protein n=1 Tax=Bradyrhizobium sp. OK095 TaxID=1882760 RepID=UPI0008B502D7|nr:hypothetical protein [Bradyrhizobium sp. OK095]SEN76592.1 Hpr(Ser) kinase/phosphatase [Bradyrhizobium sp. OK095]
MSAEPHRAAAIANSDLFLCGLRVRSTLPLPELAPWTGDDREPDLVIRTGAIPARLDGAHDMSPLLQITPQMQARLSIDGVATYWLRSSEEIIIDPQIAADRPDVRIFLFGTILGLLSHRRGLFPLHASCVRIGGNAVAIAGISGAGKSTLATALTRRGHALLSDDVCVIDPAAADGPAVLPAFPRVKLWQDSLEAMGIGSHGLAANRPGQHKYHFYLAEAANFEPSALPLKKIYLLSPSNAPLAGRNEIEKLAPTSAISGLHQQIYRKRTAAEWGLEPGLFKSLGTIVGAAEIYHLTRSPDLADLAMMVQRFEAHAAS